MSDCCICKQEIDSNLVDDELNYLFERADMYGMESLTEDEQVVVERNMCYYCFTGEERCE